MITDKFGRSFEKLRVSLINDCNFSCVYCVGDDINNTGKNTMGLLSPEFSVGKGIEKLRTDDFAQLISTMHSILNLKSIRLTGGEPLLYGELIPLIKQIKSLGIDDIRMTTDNQCLLFKRESERFAGGRFAGDQHFGGCHRS